MASLKTFHLNLVKIDGAIFNGPVVSVSLSGSEGDMTILPDHTAIVSALRAGEIVVRQSDGQVETHNVTGGTLEMSRNVLNILI